MEQPGQRQQVGTAAGREIFRNEPVIQRRERIFIRVRCLGEKGFQLFGEGQLTLPARAGNDVGIGAVGQDGQQCAAADAGDAEERRRARRNGAADRQLISVTDDSKGAGKHAKK
mgnify:CR=1 FL=1